MGHATPMSTISIMCTHTEEVIIQNTEYTFTFTFSYMYASFLTDHSQIITCVIYKGRPEKIGLSSIHLILFRLSFFMFIKWFGGKFSPLSKIYNKKDATELKITPFLENH